MWREERHGGEGPWRGPGSGGGTLETTWEERVSAGRGERGEQRIHSKAQARLRVPQGGQSQVHLRGGKGGNRVLGQRPSPPQPGPPTSPALDPDLPATIPGSGGGTKAALMSERWGAPPHPPIP